MAMEGERADLNDWEVLHNAEAEALPDSAEQSFDGESEGIIRSDYFSLDNHVRLGRQEALGEEDSVESDNPSWIDPAVPETRMMNPAEFWSDSASDRSEDRKSGDFDPKKELRLVEESEVEEFGGEVETLNNKESRELWPDTGGDGEAAAAKLAPEEIVDGGAGSEVAKADGSEGEKRGVLWWKVPMEVLKYCAFRVSPVWTFSVAAAVLGMVMLGRRLYRMKRKTQTLQLKVTMDDKKVSQFMSRAARLNEAFSVVKRVPVVRPALRAPGNIAPWPVMSLR